MPCWSGIQEGPECGGGHAFALPWRTPSAQCPVPSGNCPTPETSSSEILSLQDTLTDLTRDWRLPWSPLSSLLSPGVREAKTHPATKALGVTFRSREGLSVDDNGFCGHSFCFWLSPAPESLQHLQYIGSQESQTLRQETSRKMAQTTTGAVIGWRGQHSSLAWPQGGSKMGCYWGWALKGGNHWASWGWDGYRGMAGAM